MWLPYVMCMVLATSCKYSLSPVVVHLYILKLKKGAGLKSASTVRRRADNKDAIVELRKFLRLKGYFLCNENIITV